MVTLANLDGRSLVVDLQSALSPVFDELKQQKEEREVAELVTKAAGLPPVPQENAGGFLQKVAPGLANRIQQLNGRRDPNEIDETRQEAELNLQTSRQILAAKTPREKQKVVLARAQQIQQQGGDASEFLRMAGMSADEIDLKAQKAAMTGDATLKALPAPTERERLAARAQLAVRSPQALQLILHDEKVAREEQRRREAIAAANAKAGRKAAASAAHNEAFSRIVDSIAGTPDEAVAADTADAAAAIPEGEAVALGAEAAPDAAPEQQQKLGEQISQEEDAVFSEMAEDVAPGISEVAAPPEPAPVERFADQIRTANENANKAREMLRDPDPTIRAAAKDAVKYFEDQAKDARDSFDFEVEAAKLAEVDETATDEKIRLLEETGIPRDEAILRALGEDASKFEIREGGDGFLYYVDPTGETPARRVNPEIEAQEDDTALLQEYRVAVDQGFPGTLIDYQQARKGQGFSMTTSDGTVVQFGGPQQQAGPQPSSPAAMVASIDGILSDPALETATGIFSFLQAVPGTEQRRFGARAAQLEGQAFLQAFESLKGGGQITEIEGQKATQAIGRLDTSQRPSDYRDALLELREQLVAAQGRPPGWINTDQGQQVNAQQLQQAQVGGAPPQITTEAQYQDLPSGTVFIAPDRTQRRKP